MNVKYLIETEIWINLKISCPSQIVLLFIMLICHFQQSKVVMLEDLAAHFKLKTQVTFDFVHKK